MSAPTTARGFYRPVCPRPSCRGRIAEANTVFLWTPVIVEVTPAGRSAENTGGSDVIWDEIKSENPASPYACRSCLTPYASLDDVDLEPEGQP